MSELKWNFVDYEYVCNCARKIAKRLRCPKHISNEDICQEAFIAAIASIDTFDPTKSSFKTHVYLRVKAAISRYIHRNTSCFSVNVNDTDKDAYAYRPGQVIHKESHRIDADCVVDRSNEDHLLKELAESENSLLVRWLNGESYADIAKTEGISKWLVRAKIHSVITKLRKHFT